MRLCRVWVSLLAGLLAGLPVTAFGATPDRIDRRIDFSASHSETIDLNAGDTVEISAGIESPSKLPDNGRVAVEWSAPVENAGFRKVLHALDPDVYVLYRAPQQGRYTFSPEIENKEKRINATITAILLEFGRRQDEGHRSSPPSATRS